MTARAPRSPRAPFALACAFAIAGLATLATHEAARPRVLLPFELLSAGGDAGLGRAPGAAAGVLGIAAIFVLLTRGMDRRSGAYGALVLGTTPLWFVHARTMTGAIGSMAGGALMLAGLFVAIVDPRASRNVRAIAWCATAAGVTLLVRAHALVAVVTPVMLGVGAAAIFSDKRLVGAAVVALGLGVAAVDLATGAHALRSAASFEAPITETAYALAPWSPLVPFALVRRPRSPIHLAACASAIAALVVHAGFAPRASEGAPFLGVPFVALAVGAMIRDLDDSEKTSSMLAAAVFAVGALVVRDIGLGPERMLVGLGVHIDAAAVGSLPAASSAARTLRYAMWIVLVGSVASLLLSRALLGLERMRFGRGAMLACSGVIAGVLVRAHAWPALLAGLSPGAAFDAYVERRRAGDELGAIGVEPRTLARSARAEVGTFANAAAAVSFLDGASERHGRRFLALSAAELPRVNAAYRASHHANVPVLAGARDAVLLAANRLEPGETSESPLDAIVLAEPPASMRDAKATLGGGALDVLGWQIDDERGRKKRLRVILRVHGEAPLRGHCTFLHVDHSPTRFSAEHKAHAYPLALWREGDIVVDEYDFVLPPHFRSGSYEVSWGAGVLPCEDDRRMPVTAGLGDSHHRVPLGRLEIR